MALLSLCHNECAMPWKRSLTAIATIRQLCQHTLYMCATHRDTGEGRAIRVAVGGCDAGDIGRCSLSTIILLQVGDGDA